MISMCPVVAVVAVTATWSNSWLTMVVMRSDSWATLRGVNAWVTRLRSCLCRGGSILIRLELNGSWPCSPPPKTEENDV